MTHGELSDFISNIPYLSLSAAIDLGDLAFLDRVSQTTYYFSNASTSAEIPCTGNPRVL